MSERDSIYLDKAIESMDGAESEYANRRYDNCANRCYYACFQSAVYALYAAGMAPRGVLATWNHAAAQAEFARELVARRKRYPAELRDVLPRLHKLRQTADYTRDVVSATQADRALRRMQTFVNAVQSREARTP